MPAMTGAIIGAVGAATSIGGTIASAVGRASRGDAKFDMGAEKDFEAEGRRNAVEGQQGYRSAMANEVAQGSAAQMDLAGMLKKYAETGAIPDAQDISRSQAFARTQFDPQRVAMQQAFQQQLTGANRQAAMSGRGINDPILRAKLAQAQTQQSAILESQQGAFASQFAQQQPFQRLGFMSDRANTLVSRGQTALGNWGTMANMGLNAQQVGYGQRAQLAGAKYTEQQNQLSGGEIFGAMTSQIGSGISSIGSSIGKMPGMGSSPAAATANAQVDRQMASMPQLQPTSFMSGPQFGPQNYNPATDFRAPGADRAGPLMPQGPGTGDVRVFDLTGRKDIWGK